jgi:hypothetical protein
LSAKRLIKLLLINAIDVCANVSDNLTMCRPAGIAIFFLLSEGHAFPTYRITSMGAFLRQSDVLPARANPEREYPSRRGPTGSAPVSY